ncbi:biotin--[acetyl-CoA-carboxylase] ligase [Psychroserpens sp. XS_ASV72]|uniref:biotin--[acetyl-CoA-carboxylase] ligase n=1 Tax=Psychroserpens sp. XS_ASV72 TaxID=3241293 RepID=UPI003515BB37
MRIIKLNAIDSTNSFLRQLSVEEPLDDFTIVVANHQTKGRGQMGTNWYSENGKNLMFSTFKKIEGLEIEAHFYISIVVSLAVFMALEAYMLKNLKIKWPNDILSEQKKIAGILIENVIKKDRIQSTIIGIGLNANQTSFEELPNASSIKSLTGKDVDKDELLNRIVNQFEYYFALLENKSYDLLLKAYEDKLYRIDKPSTFKTQDDELFSGYIKGVTQNGFLKVLVEDEIVKTFDLKEVTLLS